MNQSFYAYLGKENLGSESCGSEGKFLWDDLKTAIGAINRMRKLAKGKPFKIYTYTNFYNNKTFKLIFESE